VGLMPVLYGETLFEIVLLSVSTEPNFNFNLKLLPVPVKSVP
jgi:hypothetical protein